MGRLQVIHVLPHHGRVDLEGHLTLAAIRHPSDGLVKRPRHATDGVVALSARTIEADRDAPDARRLHLPHSLRRDQGAVGRHRHAQPALGGMGSDVEHIWAHQRFAPADDKDGPGEGRNLIDQLHDLSGRQFIRVR